MKTKLKSLCPSNAAACSPPRIWVDGGIMHPCKHEASFEDSCLETDRFCCPECGLRWHMRQAPPIQHPSGWIEPGKRTLVIDNQSELPRMADAAARRILARRPKPPLARVLNQAAASDQFRGVTQMIFGGANVQADLPPNGQPDLKKDVTGG